MAAIVAKGHGGTTPLRDRFARRTGRAESGVWWRRPEHHTTAGRRYARYREGDRIRRRMLGRSDRSGARRLHQDPEQIAGLRPRLGGARPHGQGRRPVRRLGPQAPRGAARGHPRHAAAARPHAAHRHRGAGHRRRRRRRAALRPPRQAARDDRLGRGLRAMAAAPRRRPALRSRRRRRRLCDVCRTRGPLGAAHPGCAACARDRRDRSLRGIGQL